MRVYLILNERFLCEKFVNFVNVFLVVCFLNDTVLYFVGGFFLMFTSISTANKKARLINGSTSSVQHQNSNGAGSASSSDEYQTYQAQYCATASASTVTTATGQSNQSRSNGPNLVNKQLVLPFVPPSFPNGTSDGSNHLIKPSEYLKSISDKRSSASSAR